jgi:hypothetical protein
MRKECPWALHWALLAVEAALDGKGARFENRIHFCAENVRPHS